MSTLTRQNIQDVKPFVEDYLRSQRNNFSDVELMDGLIGVFGYTVVNSTMLVVAVNALMFQNEFTGWAKDWMKTNFAA